MVDSNFMMTNFEMSGVYYKTHVGDRQYVSDYLWSLSSLFVRKAGERTMPRINT